MEEKNIKNINEDKEGETKVSPLSLHNLYSHIKISVKTLDKIIIGLIIALAVIVILQFQIEVLQLNLIVRVAVVLNQ